MVTITKGGGTTRAIKAAVPIDDERSSEEELRSEARRMLEGRLRMAYLKWGGTEEELEAAMPAMLEHVRREFAYHHAMTARHPEDRL